MICGVQFGDRTEAHFPSPNSTCARINANAMADILFRSSNRQLPGNMAPWQGQPCGWGNEVPLLARASCVGASANGGMASFTWETFPSLSEKKWLVPIKETQQEHLTRARGCWAARGGHTAEMGRRVQGSTSEDPLPCGLNYILRRCLNLGFQLYQEHKEHLFSNKNILVGARERWNIWGNARHASEDSYPPKFLWCNQGRLRGTPRPEASAWGRQG